MNFIDAHSHVWTDDTAHYPSDAGWKKEDMKPPAHPRTCSSTQKPPASTA